MRELEIKFTGRPNINETAVYIDDAPVEYTKNKNGQWICKYQTENDKVNIKVYRMLDVGGIWWFLTQILFFLISIFGIFDVHRKERCLVIDFEAEVDLREQNNITLQFTRPKENQAAINVQTDLPTQVISNSYYTDTKAKKLRKGLMLTKLFTALAIIAIIIVVLIVKL